jgi:formiminoglutamase
MRSAPDMSLWTGRDDTADEGPEALRWHQCVTPWSEAAPPGVTLLGFACDEGVRRNQGRVGASKGPAALRRGLANLAWPNQERLFDAGDVGCIAQDLEKSHDELADLVRQVMATGQKVIVLGGGHGTAWGTFSGLSRVLPAWTVGIINLDAHFDLRASPTAHSGTPFRQMAEWSLQNGRRFRYFVLGIAEPANTPTLFETAKRLRVQWKYDHELTPWKLGPVIEELRAFVAGVDLVYLSVDLDVLPSAIMPAVSAPSAYGVALETVETLIQWVAGCGKLAVADVVEFNPAYDRDGLASRAAARLVWQLARHWTLAPQLREL